MAWILQEIIIIIILWFSFTQTVGNCFLFLLLTLGFYTLCNLIGHDLNFRYGKLIGSKFTNRRDFGFDSILFRFFIHFVE